METKQIYEKPYITATDIKHWGAEERIATILNEGEIITSFEKKRLFIKIQLKKTMDIKDFKIVTESWNNLSEEWGTDTKNWVGKQIKLYTHEYKDGKIGIVCRPTNIKSQE